MKYIKLFESNEDVISDINQILNDIRDVGYRVSVEESSEILKLGRKSYLSCNLEIKIESDIFIDLESISDCIMWLYDYMKGHQSCYSRNPSVKILNRNSDSDISGMIIGSAGLDKRYQSAYNKIISDCNFKVIKIIYSKK